MQVNKQAHVSIWPFPCFTYSVHNQFYIIQSSVGEDFWLGNFAFKPRCHGFCFAWFSLVLNTNKASPLFWLYFSTNL